MPKPPSSQGLTPIAAVDRLEQLYAQATAALSKALDRYIATRKPPTAAERAQFCYPLLRIEHLNLERPPTVSHRAFAKLQQPGVYETTVTHPGPFRHYLLEQLEPLVADYGARIEVRAGTQPMPYPYVLERAEELAKAGVTASELARHFPTPNLAAVGDEIADGEWQFVEGQPRPLALFDGARTDFSLRRLVHYTGTDWRHVQRWVLLTNYQRYIDQFVRWGRAQIKSDPRTSRLIMPGNIEINRSHSDAEAEALAAGAPWHKHQMPAYHLVSGQDAGVTLINIGVGPSNAKNITDHLAVIRPNCWLMVGHCGGLRESQQIGDYVLAHAYLREDRILDDLLPPQIPVPALAEVQVALQDAAAKVTGLGGEALRQRLRTGTVWTDDDRNWELRFTHERKRINLSRAIAVDMESGTIAAQGYRLRVPYGTLLCVSDKPLHGEIKLPGAANAFYETAVAQHLQVGLAAIELLKQRRETLHSRKLRSFDEPPFR
ncbi:MAG: AMP nucleosidase [Hyphomicrobiaceae bacterium]